MISFPLAAFGQTIFMLLLGAVALFLILLVLVQRGRGGGLAGALGGMGGSSAFGAKAGDVFTKITVIAATFWIVLCIAATKMTPSEESLIKTNVSGSSSTATETPILTAPPGTLESEGDAAATLDAEASNADATAEEPAEKAPAEEATTNEQSGTE